MVENCLSNAYAAVTTRRRNSARKNGVDSSDWDRCNPSANIVAARSPSFRQGRQSEAYQSTRTRFRPATNLLRTYHCRHMPRSEVLPAETIDSRGYHLERQCRRKPGKFPQSQHTLLLIFPDQRRCSHRTAGLCGPLAAMPQQGQLKKITSQ